MSKVAKSPVQDVDVLNSTSVENVKTLAPELSPVEKANARYEAQLARIEKSRQAFIEKETKKAEREAKKAENPTPWSSTMDIMVKSPDIEMSAVLEQLKAKGVDVEASKSTIHTTFAYVRRVVKGLRENGLMA
jgi:hypothetical protein